MTPFQLVTAIRPTEDTGQAPSKAAAGIDEDAIRARFASLIRQQRESVH